MEIISEVSSIKLTTLARKDAFEKPLSSIFTVEAQNIYFAKHCWNLQNLREIWQNKNKNDLIYKTQNEDRNNLIKGIYTPFSVSSLFSCYS